MFWLQVLIIASILIYLLYKWSVAKYGVFAERGIPYDKPTPLLGNLSWKLLSGKATFIEWSNALYNKYKERKIFGVYQFRDAVYFVTDLELIKKIGIKEFESFPNHRSTLPELSTNIFAKSLVQLRDKPWKEMRNTLTPTFTGSKMRNMFELINEICHEGVQQIRHDMRQKNMQSLELEMKNYFTRYANDVIATTAFGIKVNSFASQNNEFYRIGKAITQLTGWPLIKAILYGIIPKVMKKLGFKLTDDEKINYFKQLVFGAIRERQAHNIIRPDMIQLLMEAKRQFDENKSSQTQGRHAEFNDDDLLAQCLLFFLAGFETVSTCLCFTTHELLCNAEVQQRLYEEIQATEELLAGKPLNYDALNKMKYLDMVLAESLRKWPPAIVTDRECAKDHKLYDDDGRFIMEFKAKDIVVLPIVNLHYDPEYFSEPEKFMPERFAEENKQNINPVTYMPFGIGPRNCIGNRLALMETKAIVYHLVKNFKIVRGEKTVDDVMKALIGFSLKPREVFWAKFVPRD